MGDPYLILHKVRGSPAFDIAERLEVETADGFEEWWIIPTSGHRAYPYWYVPFDDVWVDTKNNPNCFFGVPIIEKLCNIPADWPDHYPCNASPLPSLGDGSLAQRLGLVKPPPTITRRI